MAGLFTALSLLLLPAQEEIRGVDSSFLPQLADLGVTFFDQGKPKEPLSSFRERGMNWLRLRVWVHPKNGYCGVPRTLELCRYAKELGYKLLIDFHYSDDWGDPQHQIAPKAWAAFSVDQLANAVYWHTRSTIEALDRQGTPADMVQIGNEVRDGLFYPTCQISKSGWGPFVKVLKAGVRGARGAFVSRKPQIAIHYDRGGRPARSMAFYEKLASFGLDYDLIQLSYYPWWHGPLPDLEKNLAALAKRFKKPIFIGECAYPFTLKWHDRVGNFVGMESQLVPGFPATPEGQAAYLRRLREIVRKTPSGLGLGVMYWAPEYVAFPGFGTPCENLALYDFDRNLLPGARALAEP